MKYKSTKQFIDSIKREIKPETIKTTITLTEVDLAKVVNRAIALTVALFAEPGTVDLEKQFIPANQILNLVDITLNPEEEEEDYE